MPNNIPRHILRPGLFALLLCQLVSGCTMDGFTPQTHENAAAAQRRPSLVVTSEPAPEVLYREGSRDGAQQNLAPVSETKFSETKSTGGGVETLVTRKVSDLNGGLSTAQHNVDALRDRLAALQSASDAQASDYYAIVASIQTQLQSGTTAGNPVLTGRWNDAQQKLETLSKGADELNTLAADAAAEATRISYLQDSVRATYGLSGAMEEDHSRLQKLEDDVNQNIVALNRLLTSVNDEINRRTSYLRAERLNLQTLSLGIANGELYGQSVSNALFRKAAADGQDFLHGSSGSAMPSSRRPLVIIRFNRPNVDYRQAVYAAVSQALEKYPAAKFDLVAVSPSSGNPAQLALASTEARKNGEAVLRSLTQMGVPLERVRLNAANAKNVTNSEVHLYIQ